MLDSVSAYMRNIVDGLAMPPGVPGPLTAWITPPAVEKMTAPRAHIWDGRLTGRRQTAPRGRGFMELSWTVDVYVSYMTTPGDGLQNEPFPKIVDAVLWAYMTTVMPVFIDVSGNPMGPNAQNETDTQIVSVGEDFTGNYPPERSVAGPRMLWYVKLLSVNVKEVVQA